MTCARSPIPLFAVGATFLLVSFKKLFPFLSVKEVLPPSPCNLLCIWGLASGCFEHVSVVIVPRRSRCSSVFRDGCISTPCSDAFSAHRSISGEFLQWHVLFFLETLKYFVCLNIFLRHSANVTTLKTCRTSRVCRRPLDVLKNM